LKVFSYKVFFHFQQGTLTKREGQGVALRLNNLVLTSYLPRF
jgi:hypothetical protein